MHLHNTRLARQLWAVVLGLMLAMLVLGGAVTAYTARVQAQSQRQLELIDKRLMLAMRWKSLGEVSVERVVVGALSSDTTVMQHMRDLSKAAIVQISETQQLLTEMAHTPQERVLLEQVAAARKTTLHWVDEVQEARSHGEMAVSLVLVQQQLRPSAQRYFAIQDGLIDLYAHMRQDVRSQALAQRNQVLWTAAGIAALLIAVTVWLTLALSRRMQRTGSRQAAAGGAAPQPGVLVMADTHSTAAG